MKKSELQLKLEKKFDYLPRQEVERTLEKFYNFFLLVCQKVRELKLETLELFL